MNISPILLLSIGCGFAFFYGCIITIGWAITRRNRKIFQKESGSNLLELFDLQTMTPTGKIVPSISLENNFFCSEEGERIDLKSFQSYIAENTSNEYPRISKSDLILIDTDSRKIVYAFKVPDLRNYR